MSGKKSPVFILLNIIVILTPLISDDARPEASAPAGIELLWKYAAGGQLVSRPAVSATGVYLYSEDRQLHALNPGGEPRWKLRISGRPADSLSIGKDGTIYLCTASGMLHAVNPAGRELWSLDAGGEPAGEPAATVSGTVYLALKSGELLAVSHTGFLRWKTDTGAELSSPPAVDAGEAIYTFGPGGGIKCWTPWGSLRWEIPPEREAERFTGGRGTGELPPSAIHDHILYTSRAKQLQAITPGGEMLWNSELSSECTALIVIPDGLFCLFEDGRTAAYDFGGGRLWTGQGAGFSSYPAAGDSGIYILRGSKLSFMDFSGRVIIDTEPEGISLNQPVLGKDLLVSGSEEWVACAFAADSSLGDIWSQKGGGASHDGTSGLRKWYFNEAEYLSNMDYLYLREFINSDSRRDKLDALEEIEDRIAADGIDRGESYMLQLVHYALTESSKRIKTNETGMSQNYPAVRKKAASILGEYGTFESIELLTAVLAEEKYQDVSAAIISALGELGADYNGLVLQAIYNKVVKDNNGSTQERLLWSAIEAVEKITAYSGIPASGYGYRVLLEIFRGNYSAGARRRAGDVLRSLK